MQRTVNGEQYFVEDNVNEELELITVPESWVCRWCAKEDIGVKDFDLTKWKIKTTQLYNKVTGNDYVYLGGEFHPDIKMVHFTHSTKNHTIGKIMRHLYDKFVNRRRVNLDISNKCTLECIVVLGKQIDLIINNLHIMI